MQQVDDEHTCSRDVVNVSVPDTYDDEVTDADITALQKHIAEQFGEATDMTLVSGPAW